MNILIIDAYFAPEIIGFTHLEHDILEGLIRAGHRVTVVCPTPSRGIPKETAQKYKSIRHETIDGVEVYRYWAPIEGRNPIIRAFRYFWCNLRGNRVGRRFRDTDVIFAVSTPPTQGLFVGKLAKKLKVPFVYSLQDVFPDSLVTTGMTTNNSWLYRIGARVEKKTYLLCSRVIVLSHSVERNLLNKGVPQSKLLTVSNWIDAEEVHPVPKEDNRLFEEFDIDRGKFNVVYAGNFGASQGAGVILEAAKLLKDDDSIRFVIFGGGAEFEQAKEIVRQEQLQNVIINPLLPMDRVSEVYSLGDVSIITCKKGVGGIAMPSKLWSIMACGTPIIAAFDTDSELADVLKASGAGVCIEPEDPKQLADAIKKHSRRQSGKTNSREYVKNNADKLICSQRYVSCIEAAADK